MTSKRRKNMSDMLSVVSYLTQEIRELVRLGAVHSYTWVSNADPGRWMQVSVHDGIQHYLTVLCVLPPDITKAQMDKVVGKVGRKQAQVNHGTCVIYYLAQSDDSAALLDQVPAAARQCASIAGLLWNATKREHLELLGARGPKLPFYGANRTIPATGKSALDAIPEAPIPRAKRPEGSYGGEASELSEL
jgi:hypothetical protein